VSRNKLVYVLFISLSIDQSLSCHSDVLCYLYMLKLNAIQWLLEYIIKPDTNTANEKAACSFEFLFNLVTSIKYLFAAGFTFWKSSPQSQ